MQLVASDGPPAPTPEASHHGSTHEDEAGDGIEWEDLMPDINRQTNLTNMVWKLIDRQTGDENASIRWAFTVGDRGTQGLVHH